MDLSDRPDTDPDLWVEVEGTAGRCYILGNPHTFPGRFVTWSDHLGNSLYVSKGEVTSCSDDARRWIEGFLNGNEPAIAEYLGIARIAADDLDDDDPGVERWRRALADFRSSGTIPLLKPVPRWPLPSAFVHGRRPWTWAGVRSGNGRPALGSWQIPNPHLTARPLREPFAPAAATVITNPSMITTLPALTAARRPRWPSPKVTPLLTTACSGA